jgi:hypothetical protein
VYCIVKMVLKFLKILYQEEEEDDEVDTDEMILERICVDTQTATDDILKTREDIQKVQDAVLLHLDGDVDVVSTAECLQVENFL